MDKEKSQELKRNIRKLPRYSTNKHAVLFPDETGDFVAVGAVMDAIHSVAPEPNQTIEQLTNVLEALEGHDIQFLGGIANKLKGDFGGEGWAIGEMVERAIKQYGESGLIRVSVSRETIDPKKTES